MAAERAARTMKRAAQRYTGTAVEGSAYVATRADMIPIMRLKPTLCNNRRQRVSLSTWAKLTLSRCLLFDESVCAAISVMSTSD